MANIRSDKSNSANNDVLPTKAGNPVYTGIVTPIAEISFDEDHALITRVSIDKKCYAVGLASGSIKMYTCDKLNLVYHLPKSDADTLSCTDLQFVPFTEKTPTERKYLIVATYASGHVKVWHYTAPTTKARLLIKFTEEKIIGPMDRPSISRDGNVAKNETMAVAVSPDGCRFVTAGEDSVIRVYDLQMKKETAKCFSTQSNDKMDGHRKRICAIQYHPRGESDDLYSHIFVSGGWDDSIQIWDDRHSHSLWQYHGPHVCASDALDIDGEMNHIIVASWRRDETIVEVLKLNEAAISDYNVTKEVNPSQPIFKPLQKILQDKTSPSMGYVAKWLGDQYLVFGGSNGNMLKVIDRTTSNTVGKVAELPNGVYSVTHNIPEIVSDKRPIRLAFCSGSKLYLIKLEKK